MLSKRCDRLAQSDVSGQWVSNVWSRDKNRLAMSVLMLGTASTLIKLSLQKMKNIAASTWQHV